MLCFSLKFQLLNISEESNIPKDWIYFLDSLLENKPSSFFSNVEDLFVLKGLRFYHRPPNIRS